MSKYDELVLDQEIICKALAITSAVMEQSNDFSFLTKEMRERLPALIKQEHTKLCLLEKCKND